MRPIEARGAFTLACAAPTDEKDDQRAEAATLLKRWLRLACGQAHPAVVFDVDHTLVEPDRNSPFGQRAIRSMCALFAHCTDVLHVPCFIVTARLDCAEGVKLLDHMLETFGLRPRATYLRPGSVPSTITALARFKADCRDDIERRFGVRVVANVGDNWHDLVRPPLSPVVQTLWDLPDDLTVLAFHREWREAMLKLPGAA